MFKATNDSRKARWLFLLVLIYWNCCKATKLIISMVGIVHFCSPFVQSVSWVLLYVLRKTEFLWKKVCMRYLAGGGKITPSKLQEVSKCFWIHFESWPGSIWDEWKNIHQGYNLLKILRVRTLSRTLFTLNESFK